METFRYRKAQRGKVPAQRFTKSKGAAKPEARLPPFRHGGAYSLAIEAAIACIDQNMQANMGSRRIRLQLAQSLLVDFGRAVEEINLRARAFGTLGQILHAGDERLDTHHATDPDLTGAIIVECEESIRPLDPDLLTDMEFFGQAPRMIPKSLGDEGDPQLIHESSEEGSVGKEGVSSVDLGGSGHIK